MTIEKTVIVIKDKGAIQKSLAELKFNEIDQPLWDNLQPWPNREFPDFDDIRAEVERIKQTLKAIPDQPVTESGSGPRGWGTKRKEGVILASDWRNLNLVHTRHYGPGKRLRDLVDDKAVNEQLMSRYFVAAQRTLAGATPPEERGIPHDFDTNRESHSITVDPDFEPNAWLPGVYLINEIWKALLSDTAKRIREYNRAFVQHHSSNRPNADKELGKADAELLSFIQTISANRSELANIVPLNVAATRYRPVINYPANADVAGTEGQPSETYIKIIRLDGYIVGAIVFVADWAGGSHSSGHAG